MEQNNIRADGQSPRPLSQAEVFDRMNRYYGLKLKPDELADCIQGARLAEGADNMHRLAVDGSSPPYEHDSWAPVTASNGTLVAYVNRSALNRTGWVPDHSTGATQTARPTRNAEPPVRRIADRPVDNSQPFALETPVTPLHSSAPTRRDISPSQPWQRNSRELIPRNTLRALFAAGVLLVSGVVLVEHAYHTNGVPLSTVVPGTSSPAGVPARKGKLPESHSRKFVRIACDEAGIDKVLDVPKPTYDCHPDVPGASDVWYINTDTTKGSVVASVDGNKPYRIIPRDKAVRFNGADMKVFVRHKRKAGEVVVAGIVVKVKE